MSAMPKQRYTLEEYFALEISTDAKYEFWQGEVYEISGVTLAHSDISVSLLCQLYQQMRDNPFHCYGSGLHIKVPARPPYRYADFCATYGRAECESIGNMDTVVNPTLVAEIFSPAKDAFGGADRFAYFQSIPSLREYLLIEQHRPLVKHYLKQVDGLWRVEEIRGLATELPLPAVGCVLSMSELYDGVDFTDAAKGPRQAE